MTKLSASQAAKETGKSIPTITRAIKSGKLSGLKLDDGGYEIDAAELFRVFPAVSNGSGQDHFKLGDETHPDIRVLQMRIEFLEKRLADREDDLEKAERTLERDLEKAETATERMHELYKDAMLRLEAPRSKGWLSWLRGD